MWILLTILTHSVHRTDFSYWIFGENPEHSMIRIYVKVDFVEFPRKFGNIAENLAKKF